MVFTEKGIKRIILGDFSSFKCSILTTKQQVTGNRHDLQLTLFLATLILLDSLNHCIHWISITFRENSTVFHKNCNDFKRFHDGNCSFPVSLASNFCTTARKYFKNPVETCYRLLKSKLQFLFFSLMFRRSRSMKWIPQNTVIHCQQTFRFSLSWKPDVLNNNVSCHLRCSPRRLRCIIFIWMWHIWVKLYY